MADQILANSATGIPTHWADMGDGTYAKVISARPSMSSGVHISAQTAATGTNWTPFGSQPCKQLTVHNNTGTVVEVSVGGTGVGIPIQTGMFYTFFGLTNASELSIRRVDQSNTQVTVQARAES